ncbi:hypothetical protein O9929_14185 [Vibrio lentus]|nr:hypothetical protein [Vibrio lentus]
MASLRDFGVSETDIVGEQHYYQDLLITSSMTGIKWTALNTRTTKRER